MSTDTLYAAGYSAGIQGMPNNPTFSLDTSLQTSYDNGYNDAKQLYISAFASGYNDSKNDLSINNSYNVSQDIQNAYNAGYYSATQSRKLNRTIISSYDWFITGVTSTGTITSIAFDNDMNIIFSGNYNTSISLYNVSGSVFKTFSNANNLAFFVAKYTYDGSGIWAINYDSSGNLDTPYKIVLDSSDNIFVAGSYNNSLNIKDASDNTYYSLTNAGTDSFLVKYNSAGIPQWHSKTSIDTSGIKNIFAFDIDSTNNIYLGLTYNVSTSIIDSSGIQSSLIPNTSTQNCALIKLNSSGNYVWNSQINSSSIGQINNVKIDYKDNIYIVGDYSGVLTLYNSNNTQYTQINNSGTSTDCFIIKYDTSGNILWKSIVTGASNESGISIDIDSYNNPYLFGFHTSQSTFRHADDISFSTIISLGNQDNYLVKYNESGIIQWLTRIGGTGIEANETPVLNTNNKICIDKNNYIYIGNSFNSGSLNIYSASDLSNVAATLVNSSSGRNGYVIKYDISGKYQYSFKTGNSSPNSTYNNSIYVDKNNYIYVGTSNVGGTITLYDASSGSIKTSLTSGNNIYIVKYSQLNRDYITYNIGFTEQNQKNQSYNSILDIQSAYEAGYNEIYKIYYYNGYYNSLFDTSPDISYSSISFLQTAYNQGFNAAKNNINTYFSRGYKDAALIKIPNSILSSNTISQSDSKLYNRIYMSGYYNQQYSNLNTNSVFEWYTRVGDVSNNETGKVVKLDKENNIYYTGTYSGAVKVRDTSNNVILDLCQNTVGSSFLIKQNQAGQILNGIRITSLHGITLERIAIDSKNNVYCACNFYKPSTATASTIIYLYDASTNALIRSFNYTGGGEIGGARPDCFILKLTPDGVPIWNTFIGGVYQQYARDLLVDKEDNVWFIGQKGLYDVNIYDRDGVNRLNIPYGGGFDDNILIKFSSDGYAILAGQTTLTNNDAVLSAATDNQSNIYMAGYHTAATTFNFYVPSGSSISTPASFAVPTGSFIIKINKNAVFQWSNHSYGWNYVVCDNNNNVLANASTPRTQKFDPSGNSLWFKTAANDIMYNAIFDSQNNIYARFGTPSRIGKFDPSGNVIPDISFVHGITSPSQIEIDSNDSIYVVGSLTTATTITGYNSNGQIAYTATSGSATTSDSILVKYRQKSKLESHRIAGNNSYINSTYNSSYSQNAKIQAVYDAGYKLQMLSSIDSFSPGTLSIQTFLTNNSSIIDDDIIFDIKNKINTNINKLISSKQEISGNLLTKFIKKKASGYDETVKPKILIVADTNPVSITSDLSDLEQYTKELYLFGNTNDIFIISIYDISYQLTITSTGAIYNNKSYTIGEYILLGTYAFHIKCLASVGGTVEYDATNDGYFAGSSDLSSNNIYQLNSYSYNTYNTGYTNGVTDKILAYNTGYENAISDISQNLYYSTVYPQLQTKYNTAYSTGRIDLSNAYVTGYDNAISEISQNDTYSLQYLQLQIRYNIAYNTGRIDLSSAYIAGYTNAVDDISQNLSYSIEYPQLQTKYDIAYNTGLTDISNAYATGYENAISDISQNLYYSTVYPQLQTKYNTTYSTGRIDLSSAYTTGYENALDDISQNLSYSTQYQQLQTRYNTAYSNALTDLSSAYTTGYENALDDISQNLSYSTQYQQLQTRYNTAYSNALTDLSSAYTTGYENALDNISKNLSYSLEYQQIQTKYNTAYDIALANMSSASATGYTHAIDEIPQNDTYLSYIQLKTIYNTSYTLGAFDLSSAYTNGYNRAINELSKEDNYSNTIQLQTKYNTAYQIGSTDILSAHIIGYTNALDNISLNTTYSSTIQIQTKYNTAYSNALIDLSSAYTTGYENALDNISQNIYYSPEYQQLQTRYNTAYSNALTDLSSAYTTGYDHAINDISQNLSYSTIYPQLQTTYNTRYQIGRTDLSSAYTTGYENALDDISLNTTYSSTIQIQTKYDIAYSNALTDLSSAYTIGYENAINDISQNLSYSTIYPQLQTTYNTRYQMGRTDLSSAYTTGYENALDDISLNTIYSSTIQIQTKYNTAYSNALTDLSSAYTVGYENAINDISQNLSYSSVYPKIQTIYNTRYQIGRTDLSSAYITGYENALSDISFNSFYSTQYSQLQTRYTTAYNTGIIDLSSAYTTGYENALDDISKNNTYSLQYSQLQTKYNTAYTIALTDLSSAYTIGYENAINDISENLSYSPYSQLQSRYHMSYLTGKADITNAYNTGFIDGVNGNAQKIGYYSISKLQQSYDKGYTEWQNAYTTATNAGYLAGISNISPVTNYSELPQLQMSYNIAYNNGKADIKTAYDTGYLEGLDEFSKNIQYSDKSQLQISYNNGYELSIIDLSSAYDIGYNAGIIFLPKNSLYSRFQQLQTRYNTGYINGTQNKVHYNKGYLDGISDLLRNNIYSDIPQIQSRYDQGYYTGQTDKSNAYNIGFADASNNIIQQINYSKTIQLQEGYNKGYNEGRLQYKVPYTIGYSSGFSSASQNIEIESINTSYDEGFVKGQTDYRVLQCQLSNWFK